MCRSPHQAVGTPALLVADHVAQVLSGPDGEEGPDPLCPSPPHLCSATGVASATHSFLDHPRPIAVQPWRRWSRARVVEANPSVGRDIPCARRRTSLQPLSTLDGSTASGCRHQECRAASRNSQTEEVREVRPRAPMTSRRDGSAIGSASADPASAPRSAADTGEGRHRRARLGHRRSQPPVAGRDAAGGLALQRLQRHGLFGGLERKDRHVWASLGRVLLGQAKVCATPDSCTGSRRRVPGQQP